MGGSRTLKEGGVCGCCLVQNRRPWAPSRAAQSAPGKGSHLVPHILPQASCQIPQPTLSSRPPSTGLGPRGLAGSQPRSQPDQAPKPGLPPFNSVALNKSRHQPEPRFPHWTIEGNNGLLTRLTGDTKPAPAESDINIDCISASEPSTLHLACVISFNHPNMSTRWVPVSSPFIDTRTTGYLPQFPCLA